MPAGLEALPPPPALPGPLPLAGQVLAVAFATVVTASNASPIVVTTATAHNLVSGVAVTISGVVGNTAANTTAVATVLTPTTFSIPVAGNGAYASGGTVAVNVLAQSVVIADPTTPANQAGVTAGGALKVDASAATQPVSGSVSVSNLPGTQPVSGSVSVSNLPATQPVSGSVSVTALPAIPTGANAIGTVGVTALPALPAGSNAIGTVGVTALPALPAGTNALGTVGVTALPALPAGTNALGSVTSNAGTNLNTSALALEAGNMATIVTNTGKIPALGQAAMAASAPVTIANNQSAVPISAATLPLPTGALAAAQLPATLGQKAMAGSASVTLASDQSAVPTSLATAPALVAGEAHVGALGGATVAVSGSVVRPANVTAYAAGQVVGTASTDVIAIAGAARKVGGSGVILDALIVDQGGAAASAALELYLFTASPTVQADQAAFALVAADLAALVAVVPVGSSYVTNVAATISGSRAYPVPGVNAGFVCAGGSTTLYGVLVQRSAYTPVSAESWTLILQISQD